jgi:hypothetical protein
MYLKFLAPSMEKIGISIGSNKFINQEICIYYVVSVDVTRSCWEWFLRNVHPIKWMRLIMICCVMTMMWMAIVGVCVRKLKALSLKLETVTLIGKGR